MRRFGALLAPACLGFLLAGCDSGGLKEGMSTEPPAASGAPSGFQAEMERASKNMQIKGKPKALPKAAPEAGK